MAGTRPDLALLQRDVVKDTQIDAYIDLMQQCWNGIAGARPTIRAVLRWLRGMVDGDEDSDTGNNDSSSSGRNSSRYSTGSTIGGGFRVALQSADGDAQA